MIVLKNDPYPSRNGGINDVIDRKEPVVYQADENISHNLLHQRHLDEFNKKGFLILQNLLSEEEVWDLKREMGELLLTEPADRDETFVQERESDEIRSVFHIHHCNRVFNKLARNKKLVKVAEAILGSEVYIHQSRLNFKPGFKGKEFYWHSDFETWHVEDGMPGMRAVSCSIALSDNCEHNGPLMIIPGSHRHFISCQGYTPENHYKSSLKKQEYGIPGDAQLNWLVQKYGIETFTGKSGSVAFFDCNTMHGSNSNITPMSRSNIFFVYNSVKNKLTDPFSGMAPRPEHIASRSSTPTVIPA